MTDTDQIVNMATRIAHAIGQRDLDALAHLLAPGFLFRAPGGEGQDAATFFDGIRQIPGDIVFVRLVSLTVDLTDDGAVATGVQHAQVRVDGTIVDDKRPFVDWFVKHEGEWRLRLAVDLPPLDAAS